MDANTKLVQLKNQYDENIRKSMEVELDKVRKNAPHWQDSSSYAEYEKKQKKHIHKLDAIRDEFEAKMYLAWKGK